MTENKLIPLHKIQKGSRVWIVQILEGKGKNQLIRLGISKGDFMRCLERLPGGTIVIEKNRREIAIGMALAKSIFVAVISTKETEQITKKIYE